MWKKVDYINTWYAETQRRQIYITAASGNWSEASSYYKIHPYWWRIPLNGVGTTALHVAVSMEQTTFVKNLMRCMDKEDLKNYKEEGNTAFCLAAMTGNVEIAEILLCKNDSLLWIRDQNHMLPIEIASSAGHISMTKFLFQKTSEDPRYKLPFPDIVKLFFFTINNNIYSKLMSISSFLNSNMLRCCFSLTHAFLHFTLRIWQPSHQNYWIANPNWLLLKTKRSWRLCKC